MPKNRRPILLHPMPIADDVTAAEVAAAAEAVINVEHRLDELATEIAVLRAWLDEPAYACMTGSLHAAINERLDQRSVLLATPLTIPVPA